VAPYVVRSIRRYILGPDSLEGKAPPRKLILPGDAAPANPLPDVPIDSTAAAPRVETRR
jgi:hypothetical protein